jgi:hypothetical protein
LDATQRNATQRNATQRNATQRNILLMLLLILSIPNWCFSQFVNTNPEITATWADKSITLSLGKNGTSNALSTIKSCECIVFHPTHISLTSPSQTTVGVNMLIESGDSDYPNDHRLVSCESASSPWIKVQENLHTTFNPPFSNTTLVSIYHINLNTSYDDETTWNVPDFHFTNNSAGAWWRVAYWIGSPTENPYLLNETKFISFFVEARKPQHELSGLLSDTGPAAFPNGGIPTSAATPGSIAYYVSSNLNINTNLFAKGVDPTVQRLKIYVAADASITVTSGATFTMKDADIVGCEFLHNGVNVAATGNFTAINSSISDATTALTVVNGGRANSLSTNYTNNYRGIFLNGIKNAASPPTLTGCNWNSFTRTRALKPMSPELLVDPTSYGIKANYGSNLILGFSSFSDVVDGVLAEGTNVFGNLNGFTRLNKGVTSNFASVLELGDEITGNGFEKVRYGISGAFVRNTFLANNIMKNVEQGIYANHTPKGAILDCNHNVIGATNFGFKGTSNPKLNPKSQLFANNITVDGTLTGFFNGTGISLNSSHDGLKVNQNNIKIAYASRGIDGNGIKLLSILDNKINVSNAYLTAADCIHLENSNSLSIGCNQLDRTTAGLAVGDGKTRGLYSASGTKNLIRCNTVNDLSHGIEFFDAATDITLQGNQFSNLFHGLEMAEMAWIGKQYEANTDVGYGNRWTNNVETSNAGQVGAYHNSALPTVIDLSKFHVNSKLTNCGNPVFLPTNNQTNWFSPNLTCAIQCGGSCPPPVVPGLLSPNTPKTLKEQIANGQIDMLSIPAGMKAKSRMQLYRILDEQPTLLSDASMNTFKNVETGTTIGAFYAIEKSISNLPSLSITDSTTIATQTTMLKNALKGIWQINLTATPNETQRNQLFAQATTASNQIQAIDEAQRNLTSMQLQFLKAQNAAISVSEPWEINQKAVNNWTLTGLNGEDLAASVAPLALNIANQCPLEGGDAVYAARGIYNNNFDAAKTFDDALLCANVGHRSEPAGKVVTNDLLIYPNPTDDLLYIESKNIENTTFSMVNSLGQIVKSGTLDGSAISTSDLISGLYWLLIQQPNTRLQTTKIVISR